MSFTFSNNRGLRPFSNNRGLNSVAVAVGFQGKAKSTKGNFIVLAEYNECGNLIDVKSHKVDGKTVKADTWYKLQGGKFIECTDEEVEND